MPVSREKSMQQGEAQHNTADLVASWHYTDTTGIYSSSAYEWHYVHYVRQQVFN